jgi:hypothetical protein
MMPGRKFSFSRMITNAFPNFANDSPNDVDLSPPQADNLLAYQLSLPAPRHLDAKSFFVAGITGSESLSRKVHKALVKAHIILPVPATPATGDAQMTVNTAGIGRGFTSQLAVISVHAQRKLVGLLFFWEEECTRWKLLDEEEREILSVLRSTEVGGVDAVEGVETGENDLDLRVALAQVEMRKRMLPSRRREGTANVGNGVGMGEELPSYS